MFPECSGNYNLCNKEDIRDLNICIDIESIPFQEVPLSITQYVEDLRNLYFQGRWTKQKKETPWEMPEVDISALPKNNLGQFYNFYPFSIFQLHSCVQPPTGIGVCDSLLDCWTLSCLLCLKSFNLWWLVRKVWTVHCFQTFTSTGLECSRSRHKCNNPSEKII